ncbi:hypothetical protein CPAV1605_761 [seawater metagenome]|uniref:Uncharacterized protein n=1 Tax=seawater metagenome TaxID=1561972 RepID=A0A5E8CIV4_9ZZZZ
MFEINIFAPNPNEISLLTKNTLYTILIFFSALFHLITLHYSLFSFFILLITNVFWGYDIIRAYTVGNKVDILHHVLHLLCFSIVMYFKTVFVGFAFLFVIELPELSNNLVKWMIFYNKQKILGWLNRVRMFKIIFLFNVIRTIGFFFVSWWFIMTPCAIHTNFIAYNIVKSCIVLYQLLLIHYCKRKYRLARRNR